MFKNREWWQKGAGLSCRPDLLLLLLVFGMLGFPDSITPVITAIIYEAGKRISDSGDQQLARSQHTACLLLRPFILHTFIYSVSPHSSLVLVLTSTFSLAKSCSNLWIFRLFEGFFFCLGISGNTLRTLTFCRACQKEFLEMWEITNWRGAKKAGWGKVGTKNGYYNI